MTWTAWTFEAMLLVVIPVHVSTVLAPLAVKLPVASTRRVPVTVRRFALAGALPATSTLYASDAPADVPKLLYMKDSVYVCPGKVARVCVSVSLPLPLLTFRSVSLIVQKRARRNGVTEEEGTV